MDATAQLEALEREKERMVHRYLELQDQADELNEAIYRVCCDIEILNCKINRIKEELRLLARKAGMNAPIRPPPANGI